MITLEEYKKYLIEYYRYEYDNSIEKRLERTLLLGRKFNDLLIQKIINDTYDLIKEVLDSDEAKNGYCKFELDEDSTSYISLGLVGGYFTDILFKDNKGRIISRYIMQKVFGSYFYIDVTEEEYYFTDEDDFDGVDIIGVDCHYSLYMQGFPNNLDEIKNDLFGETRELSK